MKKLISLILALLLTLGMLAACSGGDDNGEGGDTTSADTTGGIVDGTLLDIASFTIIKGNNCTNAESEAATALRMAIKDKTGKNLKVTADVNVTANDSSYEILIGKTNRKESAAVTEELGTTAKYVVRLVGNKIIICSNYDALTAKAVDYFIETVLSTVNENNAIVMSDGYISEEFATLKIMENNEMLYSIVQDSDASAPVKTAVAAVLEKINSTASLTLKASEDTSGDHSDSVKEILLGNTSVAASASAQKTLKSSQYGIINSANKISVLGTTHATSEKAINYFAETLQLVKNSDGKYDACLLFEENIILEDTAFFLDFAKPEDVDGCTVTYVGNRDLANSNMLYLYSDADEADYNKYCQAIVSAGFTKYDDNDIAGNKFATYTNDKGVLTLSFFPSESTLRVISAPKANTTLYPLTAGEYTPLSTDPSSVALISIVNPDASGTPQGNGLSMVFTLDDGSYIIVDGGQTDENAQMLYEYLDTNNKRKDGIVIAAWFLTHGHSDHYGCFTRFMANKEYYENVICEAVICSGYNADGTDGAMGIDTILTGNVPSLVTKFKNDDCKVIKLHTGQQMQFRNATLDVLFTHEDVYPGILNEGNDTSTLIMFTINGKKTLITGDATAKIANIVTPRYGDALKCDYLQVPHHGGVGAHDVTAFVDAAVSSTTIALYPTDEGGKTKNDALPSNVYINGKVAASYYAYDYNTTYSKGEHKVFALN